MLHFVTNKKFLLLKRFPLLLRHNFYYLYIMMTLFIFNGKMMYVFIFLALLVLNAVSNYMLTLHKELYSKVCHMTDTELIVHFRSLAEDYNRKATYRKGQELAHLLKERKRRKLLEKMSDTELNDCYRQLVTSFEQAPTFWKGKELAYYREEVEKRHLL